MDGFRLCFATSGPTKRRKHYFRLLFSQYCVCYFLNIVSNPNLPTSPKNQFRDYHAWNRIEKLMPQHWQTVPQTFKTLRKTANLFSNLDFLPKSGFPKTLDLSMDFPRIFHGFPTPCHAKAESPGCLKAAVYAPFLLFRCCFGSLVWCPQTHLRPFFSKLASSSSP